MKGTFFRGAAAALLVLGAAGVASAQVTVTLPDTSQTTTLTASVQEQARVTTPATVTFTVNDITTTTAGSAAAVTVTNIVLATALNQLKISLQANAANFTPPVVGATTWAASDVSWTGGTWTAATGAGNTLSSAAYNEVASCDADVTGCSTSDVAFTLAAKSSVQRAGNHTLVIRWKFEKI